MRFIYIRVHSSMNLQSIVENARVSPANQVGHVGRVANALRPIKLLPAELIVACQISHRIQLYSCMRHTPMVEGARIRPVY